MGRRIRAGDEGQRTGMVLAKVANPEHAALDECKRFIT
jgi:hypothetical protein